MLTRLKVSGFKSLVDVDVRFGPFTCIAGANGAGKSNLFDAILFLSALADDTLVKAAESVRPHSGSGGDFWGIFHRTPGYMSDRVRLEAELILPRIGLDEHGQRFEATSTFVRYAVELGLRSPASGRYEFGLFELFDEALESIPRESCEDHLLFPHTSDWRESVVQGSERRQLITTRNGAEKREVVLHSEHPNEEKEFTTPAESRPRTILSSVADKRYSTAMLARLEMRSWRRLHLEGEALRNEDPLGAPTRLGGDGDHLPATLHALATRRKLGEDDEASAAHEAAVYARAANRLAELNEDVREVSVHQSKARQVLLLTVTTRDGTVHAASALSDGTLRFLALAVLELDHRIEGLLCIEEPENGIHPRRIAAMLRLFQDIATDTSLAVDEDNPLRQVLINTHSPTVVLQVPEGALLMAEWAGGVRSAGNASTDPGNLLNIFPNAGDLLETTSEPEVSTELHDASSTRAVQVTPIRYWHSRFSCLSGTWRERAGRKQSVASLGSVLGFLNASAAERDAEMTLTRVMDRADVRKYLPGLGTGS